MAERIVIGPDYNNPLFVFENANIKECQCVLSSSLSGDQLAVDEFRPVIYSAAYIRVKFVPSRSAGMITADGKRFRTYPGLGFLDKIPYGTPIWYYSNGTLIGKFYSQKITRTAKWYFDIIAVSAIGILEGQRHLGNVYAGMTFQAVANEIIGGAYQFTCSDEVENLRVYGWLPIASKRDNLHQLLFATGVMLDKDAAGELYFRFPDSNTQKKVPNNRIFLGGSIDYRSPASKAEITEHAFVTLSTDREVTLFDNTDGSGEANNTFVSFADAPVHDLSASGHLTIVSSGVNWAIVTGTGTLTGKAYTHVTKIITREASGGEAEKTVSVTGATLVSIANSENVAQRVISYYNSARAISADIKVDGERPGDQISFNDPYDEPATAFIESMDINASSFLRAGCELVTNYVPSGQGNNYNKVIVLTGAGSYNFPPGTKAAFVAVIGAGNGGASGGKGANGEGGSVFNSDYNGGQGGVAGLGGTGGKILSFKLNNPSGSYSYSCGVAGIGASPAEENTSVSGTVGGESTFGNYTSANGVLSNTGYVNLFTGEVYALPGADGVAGGNGADKNNRLVTVNVGGKTWRSGDQGATFSGEAGTGEGGFGGGPAYGANGNDGGDGRGAYDYAAGGNAGDGASPYNGTDADTYGCGGGGGHGGGGGGAGGRGAGRIDKDRPMNGNGGDGAIGSRGGNAAAGCIVIYL